MRTTRRDRILLCLHRARPQAKSVQNLGPFSPGGRFSSYACSAYIGCQHDCHWGEIRCDAKEEAWRLGKSWGYPDWFVGQIDEEWKNPLIVENALELLEKELQTKKPGRVFLSPTSDPYQPIEEDLELTRGIIERLPCPVTILTKATDLPRRDFDLVADDLTWFGVTISEEDGAAQARTKLLQEGKIRGMSTFIYLYPWLPGVNALQIMASRQDIVDFWFVGPLLNNARRAVSPEFYEAELPPLLAWLEKEGLRDKVHITEELFRAARVNDVGSAEPWWWSLLNLWHGLMGRNSALSLLLIDLDQLTAINNNYGYSIGNQVLGEITSILRRGIRRGDYLIPYAIPYTRECRLVLAPHADPEAARILAEKLRNLVQNQPFAYEGEEFSATISVGVATSSYHTGGPEAFIENAFRALDQAKAGGGNQAVVYSGLPPTTRVEWPRNCIESAELYPFGTV